MPRSTRHSCSTDPSPNLSPGALQVASESRQLSRQSVASRSPGCQCWVQWVASELLKVASPRACYLATTGNLAHGSQLGSIRGQCDPSAKARDCRFLTPCFQLAAGAAGGGGVKCEQLKSPERRDATSGHQDTDAAYGRIGRT
jgi:hypothetical protein